MSVCISPTYGFLSVGDRETEKDEERKEYAHLKTKTTALTMHMCVKGREKECVCVWVCARAGVCIGVSAVSQASNGTSREVKQQSPHL